MRYRVTEYHADRDENWKHGVGSSLSGMEYKVRSARRRKGRILHKYE